MEITKGILGGNVAAKILEYAKKNQFDSNVAGNNGHGVLDEMLLGSETRNLVSQSPIPVLW